MNVRKFVWSLALLIITAIGVQAQEERFEAPSPIKITNRPLGGGNFSAWLQRQPQIGQLQLVANFLHQRPELIAVWDGSVDAAKNSIGAGYQDGIQWQLGALAAAKTYFETQGLGGQCRFDPVPIYESKKGNEYRWIRAKFLLNTDKRLAQLEQVTGNWQRDQILATARAGQTSQVIFRAVYIEYESGEEEELGDFRLAFIKIGAEQEKVYYTSGDTGQIAVELAPGAYNIAWGAENCEPDIRRNVQIAGGQIMALEGILREKVKIPPIPESPSAYMSRQWDWTGQGGVGIAYNSFTEGLIPTLALGLGVEKGSYELHSRLNIIPPIRQAAGPQVATEGKKLYRGLGGEIDFGVHLGKALWLTIGLGYQGIELWSAETGKWVEKSEGIKLATGLNFRLSKSLRLEFNGNLLPGNVIDETGWTATTRQLNIEAETGLIFVIGGHE